MTVMMLSGTASLLKYKQLKFRKEGVAGGADINLTHRNTKNKVLPNEKESP